MSRLKVALDVQLAVGTATGIGAYERDLARALPGAQVDVCALAAPWLDPWRFDRRVAWDQVLFPCSTPLRERCPSSRACRSW
jgi:hypothetical protein